MLDRLAVTPAERGDVLARLHAAPGIDEVAVLSTCNRVEVYAAASGPAEQVTRAVSDLMAARGNAQAGEILRLARVRVGGEAAGHLFSVACGLDSMAVGEDQIVAQIKDAARAARAAGTTGPAITGLIDAALRASKRARTQTTIGTEGISLARPASTSPPGTWAGSPAAMRSCSGPAAWASSRPGCCARPASAGWGWPAAARREPPRWPQRCAAGPSWRATCPPRSPAPTS